MDLVSGNTPSETCRNQIGYASQIFDENPSSAFVVYADNRIYRFRFPFHNCRNPRLTCTPKYLLRLHVGKLEEIEKTFSQFGSCNAVENPFPIFPILYQPHVLQDI